MAAAFPQLDDTRLAVMSPRGAILDEATVPGRIYHMLWRPEHGILATMVQLESLSIGVRVMTSLVQWDGQGVPLRIVSLHSVIVRIDLETLG